MVAAINPKFAVIMFSWVLSRFTPLCPSRPVRHAIEPFNNPLRICATTWIIQFFRNKVFLIVIHFPYKSLIRVPVRVSRVALHYVTFDVFLFHSSNMAFLKRKLFPYICLPYLLYFVHNLKVHISSILPNQQLSPYCPFLAGVLA